MPRILTPKEHAGKRLGFDYSYKIDEDKRTVKVECSLTPYPYTDKANDPYDYDTYHFLQGTNNKIKLSWNDNTAEFSWDKVRDNNYRDGNPSYNALCDRGSKYDKEYNGKTQWVSGSGGWWWVHFLGTEFYKKTFTVKYNKAGHASFKVYVSFAWFAESPQVASEKQKIEKTIELPDIKAYYNIEYNANGGKGAPSDGIKYEGKSYKISTKIPTLKGYDFVNWILVRTSELKLAGMGGPAEVKTSNKKYVKPGDTIDADKNHDYTLVANWKKKEIPIRYDANGGKGAPNTSTKKYDEKFIVSSKEPTRTGYTFINWNISGLKDKDGDPINVNAGGTIKPSRNNLSGYTLVARWKANKYTITLKNHPNLSIEGLPISFVQEFDTKISAENKKKFTAYKDKFIKLGYKQLVTKNGDPYWVTKLTKAGEAIYVGPRSQAEKDSIQNNSFNYFYDNKYTIANNLTLYPVLAYNTLCYVKDGGKWKLALPYVKDGGKWKLALMYGKDGGKWKL